MDEWEKDKVDLSLICLSIAENSEFWPLCCQSYIDQQLRLLLHTPRVVAENVDLVIIILINFI